MEGVSDAVLEQSIEGEFGRSLPDGFMADLDRRLMAASAGSLEPVEEVMGALRRLRGDQALVALDREPVVRTALEQLGLWRRFTARLFTADQVARVPPAPDLYQLAAAQLGVPASRCLVVESTAHGVRGGKAAGMTVFGFAGTGYGFTEAQSALLRAAGADLVFDRMRELPPLAGARAA
jgi:HAD superfamily hydrolase (TIGR01509 family)